MRLCSIVVLVTIFFTTGHTDHSFKKRAFWVVRYALSSPQEIEKIISTANANAITDIFVQIRALGESYYLSDYEPRAPFASGDFDPFAYLLELSKKSNVNIHAWVNMFYIWAGASQPRQAAHMFQLHKEHILRLESFPTYKEIRQKGMEGFFVDPQNIAVQNYLLNLLQEIADKYHMSGIHLDYFRYPDVSYSFTPESRTEYLLAKHYDPLQVYRDGGKYANTYGFQVFRFADKEYRKSRIAILTNYLNRIKEELHKIRPDLILTVAVKPDPVQAKNRYFQDWLEWLARDYCDFVAIMNYRREHDRFMSVLDQLNTPGVKEKIIVGISTYNQDEAAVRSRLRIVDALNFAGFSLFSYNHLSQNQKYMENLRLYN